MLKLLEQISKEKEKVRIVSRLAFNAVDADYSGCLDVPELLDIMKEVSDTQDMKLPSENDIHAILSMIDDDDSGEIDQDEFYQLILVTIRKLLEDEREFVGVMLNNSKKMVKVESKLL